MKRSGMTDEERIAAALEALRRDLEDGNVPDPELRRRIDAFADLFLPADNADGAAADVQPGTGPIAGGRPSS